MDKAEFEIVLINLVKLLDACEEIMLTVPNTDAFKELPYSKALSLTDKAKDLQGKQDKFFHDELYHILGMGKLTTIQEMLINKIVIRLGHTRGYIKAVACLKLPPAPQIPNKSDYRCDISGITLKYRA